MNYFISSKAKHYDTYIIPIETNSTEIYVSDDTICKDIINVANVIIKDGKLSTIPKSFSVVIDDKIKNIILYIANDENLRAKFLQLGKVFKLATSATKIAFIAENTPKNFVTFDEKVKLFEVFELVNYKFDVFKTNVSKTDKPCVDYYLNEEQSNDADKAMAEAAALSIGNYIARDAVNYPVTHMSPQDFAKLSVEKGVEFGFETEIIDEAALKAMGADSLLAVGGGSKNPPVMIVMRYNGASENDLKHAIIGKGIMYDSGGYSLKPKESMIAMHTDMGGAAATLGAMCAACSMKLKVNLVAIVPACENLLGENAYLPGAIIGSLLGRTTEITSTDGEGRLVLADAITYAWQTEKADTLIDIATLTGAAIVAVGKKTCVGITAHEEFWDRVSSASKSSCEKVWRFDMDEELREDLSSFRADGKNSPTGAKHGGTILGALYLRPFTNNLPWLHLDIAGVAWSLIETETSPKGATGFGVDLLYNTIKTLEVK